LECFAVLNRRFFFTAATGDRVNTGCIPRETGAVVEEKMHSKPCKSLCESAQGGLHFFVRTKRLCQGQAHLILRQIHGVITFRDDLFTDDLKSKTRIKADGPGIGLIYIQQQTVDALGLAVLN